MTQPLTMQPATRRDAHEGSGSLLSPTDVLIDAITGDTREELVGKPVAVIHAALCAQLRAMGLRPNEAKVRRIAAWINADEAPLDAG